MINDVLIYGAGEMGRSTLCWLKNAGINPKAILDRNGEMQGRFLDGVVITLPEDAFYNQNTTVVVAMSARPFFEICEYLKGLGAQHIVPAGDYVSSLFTDVKFANVWKFNDEDCSDLSIELDEKSQRDYLMAKGWFFNRDERHFCCTDIVIDRQKYFPDFIIKIIRKDDFYVDAWQMGGEYWDSFITITGNSPKGVCFAADVEWNNEEERKHKFYLGERDFVNRTSLCGLMRPFVTNDEYLCETKTLDGEKLTKMDYFRVYSMNPVLPILKGSIHSITRCRPIIAINIGHFKSDFFTVPMWLSENLRDYVYNFRIHSFQGNDCILYAIPRERLI